MTTPNPYKDNSTVIQEYIEKILENKSFRTMVQAGAEIPNYILPFPVKQTIEYSKMARRIIKRLSEKGIRIESINLYDEILSLIGDDLQDYLESNLSKQELFEDFLNILDLNNAFAPHIAEIIDSSNAEVVFFTGVGEAYPFVRIHSLLEALPTKVKKIKPIIVFYPGTYVKFSGNSCFRLFNKLSPVNYYRAFNIFSEVQYHGYST